MSGFPGSPRLTKAGLVLIDPESGAIGRIVTLQYNSENLSRSLQVEAVADDGDRSRALRLRGPAVETFTLEAVLDATDQLEFPDSNPAVTDAGLFPQIAAMETLIYPTSAQLRQQDRLAASGSFEIAAAETPLALFVWSRHRIVPVRVTALAVTEEAFDPALNPILARVNLSLRALSTEDLGFQHRGGGLFLAYLAAKETLAARAPGGSLARFGVGSLP